MAAKAGIYCLLNTVNGKRYIGQATDLRSRRNVHFSMLRRGLHYNQHLQTAFSRYGEAVFEWSVLEETCPDNLDERERTWILQHRSSERDFGYNEESGGTLRHTHTEEARHRIAVALTGNKNGLGHVTSEDARHRMSEAKMGHEVRQETRKKLSDKLKGRVISEETRQKMSKAQKGRVFSPEHRRKLSQAQMGNKKCFGHKHAENSRRKMSEALMGRTLSEEHCHKMSLAKKGFLGRLLVGLRKKRGINPVGVTISHLCSKLTSSFVMSLATRTGSATRKSSAS